MGDYTHLSLRERRQLYVFLKMGLSIAKIAERLNRHRSSLYRELQRNKDDSYLPVIAHQHAQRRAKEQRYSKLQKDKLLHDYVINHLKEGWSPEQIAGRLKVENKKYYVCAESIYRYIYQTKNKELYYCLALKKSKRRRHFSRKKQRCRYGEIRLITQRPAEIALRTHYGHWEGDTIAFQKTRKSSVTTLVERKSRMIRLIKNTTKQSEKVMSAIREKFQGESPKICKTITFDQGVEFANYRLVEKGLACKIYYCEPHSPWQKGGNENMNGRLRRYLPPRTPIHEVTQQQLDLLAKKMNNVPRKCLGFKKPKELFFQYQKNICRTWS